ncbi:DUF488 domain-containing protein [Mariniflexile ostreae]|uniref:DUF488 domain-containing protein n=1 Tax=Mariniflexile ostreae TaxID=1520892 RepID=A0ABV5F6T1_9FLAO
MKKIRIKRIYEEVLEEDGCRILVDRIWPRGVSKEDAKLDDWNKDVAPSEKLRKWFNHDPDKFDAFAEKYRKELHDKGDVLESIRKQAGHNAVTLLYAAKDTKHNQAIVLREVLKSLQE